MTQNNLKSCIRKINSHKKRAVAEVISSLLLVAITVVGAVILTTFLDETFVSGGLAASGSDSTIKTLKLIKYDSRDGGNLMDFLNLNNTSPVDQRLCRVSCSSDFDESPTYNGTEFIVIQVENQSVNPIYLHDIWLGNTSHSWDSNTALVDLNTAAATSFNGDYPADGTFSILSTDTTDIEQREDNEIKNGESVNLLIKLDSVNPDIPTSKTLRTQFNIGANQLQEFLIETGGAQ